MDLEECDIFSLGVSFLFVYLLVISNLGIVKVKKLALFSVARFLLGFLVM